MGTSWDRFSYISMDEFFKMIEDAESESRFKREYLGEFVTSQPEEKSMAKAIKIQESNFRRLEEQYNLEEDYLLDKFGLFMLVVFGFDQVEGYLTQHNLTSQFKKTRDLENGWFEVAAIDL